MNTAYGYFLDQAERSSLGLMACLHTNGSDVRRTATAVRHAREAAHWGRLALAIKSMLVVLLVVGLAGGVEAQEDLWTPSIEQAGAVVMAEAVSAQWKWQGEKGPFGNVKRTPLSCGRRDVAGRSGATGGDVATGAHQRVFFCRAWAVWFRWAALRR